MRVVPSNQSITFGADPEVFLRRKATGHIVPSSEVIPGAPLQAEKTRDLRAYKSNIARDGIQAELHPVAHGCRQEMGIDILSCLSTLARAAKRVGAEIDFSSVVDVDEETFAALPASVKELGCGRSLNVWDPAASVGVDGQTYRTRSAAGHVHLGFTNTICSAWPAHGQYRIDSEDRIPQLVKLLDLVVGNTCVMLDRDPRAAERRRTYGRAGEYRLTSYGMEYRTLSNFWLRSPYLSSLVFSLARKAAMLWINAYPMWEFAWSNAQRMYQYRVSATPQIDLGELFSLVDPAAVVKAINENDFTLARQNYNAIRDVLRQSAEPCSNDPFTREHQAGLDQLITEGIDAHFPLDTEMILGAWEWYPAGGYHAGWEAWCERKRHQQLHDWEHDYELKWAAFRKSHANQGAATW